MVSDVGFRSERGPILISLMVTTGLVAIDATVLATAVPSIVEDLGGFSQFPWLFSIYLLAQAVSVPIYSKLGDMVGRKPIILIGIGLFLLGSILCGFAWSMPALIAFRAVQGLGAGAVQPMSITIVGDIYTVAERAKTQGYLASVWAVSSVLGPTLGGVFSQLGIWRWMFFINIPLGLLAALLLRAALPREGRAPQAPHRLRGRGAARGVDDAADPRRARGRPGLGLELVAVDRRVRGRRTAADRVRARRAQGGRADAAAVGVLATAAAHHDARRPRGRRRAHRPHLVRARPTSRVRSGVAPIVAGLALAALTLGWPLAATFSGRLFYLRFGFRTTALIGLTLVVLGAASLAIVAHTPSVVLVAISCFFIGIGMGLSAVPSLIAAQTSVPWHERGVVTGANMFARSIGSAVGVAIFGALANAVFGQSSSIEDLEPGVVVAGSSIVFIAVAVAALGQLGRRARDAEDAGRGPERARQRRRRAEARGEPLADVD